MVNLHTLSSSLHSIAVNSSLKVFEAPYLKPPIAGRPKVINLLHSELGYGYLGNQCVPGYNFSGFLPTGPTLNNEWRIVCKAPSQVFVVVMAIHMPEADVGGDYLQMRRRGFGGISTKFEGFNLKKNSVVIGHVVGEGEESGKGPEFMNDEEIIVDTDFRLAYICTSKTECNRHALDSSLWNETL